MINDEPQAPRPSRLPAASLALSGAAWAAWLLWALAFVLLVAGGTLDASLDVDTLGEGLGSAAVFAVCPVTSLLAILGFILGIRALVQQAPRRGLAIAGVLLALGCLIPYVLLAAYLLLLDQGLAPAF